MTETQPVYIGRSDGSVGQLDPETPPERVDEVLADAAEYGWYRITAERYNQLKDLPINQPGPIEEGE